MKKYQMIKKKCELFCAKRCCWVSGAIAILLSFLFSIGLLTSCLATKKKSLPALLINSINEEWYLNNFFSILNSSEGNPAIPNDIVIIDISDSFSSRKDIANVIKAIAIQKPQIICVDLLFPENDSYDTGQSIFLQQTIEEIKDSSNIVVVANRDQDNNINHSFFTQPLNLQYGFSDFLGFEKCVSDTSNPRISLKIVELMGKDIKSLPDSFITNYRYKCFDTECGNVIEIHDSSDVSSLSVIKSNNVVLIGQMNYNDIHVAPFFINQKTKSIYGIETVAYEVASILSYCNDNKKFEMEYPYTFSSIWCNILLYVLFSVFYCVGVCLLNRICCFIKNKKWRVFWESLLSVGFLLFFEIVIIRFCFYVVTLRMFKIPDISLFIISLFFVESLYFCFYDILKNSEYE